MKLTYVEVATRDFPLEDRLQSDSRFNVGLYFYRADDKPEKPEKIEKPAKPGKSEKIERPERPDDE